MSYNLIIIIIITVMMIIIILIIIVIVRGDDGDGCHARTTEIDAHPRAFVPPPPAVRPSTPFALLRSGRAKINTPFS